MNSQQGAEPSKDLELFGVFWKQMLKESDRGFVLIASGYLEELLKNLIMAQVVEGMKEKDVPLGPFSSRIKLAHALGIISSKEFHDLKIIRDVRNDLAHKLDVSFDAPEIVAKCKSLKMKADGCKGEPFMQLKMVSLIIIAGLQKRIAEVKKRRLKPMEVLDPFDIVQNFVGAS